MDDLPTEVVPDRYTLTGILGEGAFGVVYAARDRSLDRPVAVKLARTADAALIARLRREIEVFHGLRHPGIVNLLDSFETPDGRIGLVFERTTAASLAQVLRDHGPLAPDACRALTLQLLETLSHVHGRGLIHRDIKPENILLTAKGRALLVDFGVAGALTERDANWDQTTVVGQLFGTPRYMAPEQALGERQSVASDLWAVALVYVEMRTGTPLFKGLGIPELLERILSSSLVLPPEIETDPVASRFVRACLARDPAQRPRSAADAAALFSAAAGAPAPLVPDLLPSTGEADAPPPPSPSQRSLLDTSAAVRIPVAGAAQTSDRDQSAVVDFGLTGAKPAEARRRRLPLLAIGAATLVALALLAAVLTLVFGPGPTVLGVFGPLPTDLPPQPLPKPPPTVQPKPQSPPLPPPSTVDLGDAQTDAQTIGALALVLGGVALIPAGLWLARRLRRRSTGDRMAMAGRAGALLADVRHRDSLTQTIAIEIERLHEQCRSLDERLMASTVALMFGEYAAATTSDDRQKALMNAVQLLEKVSNRIEPWYRRHDMLLARGLSVITLLSGFLAAIEGVRRLVP